MLKQKKEARLSISAHFKVFQIKFAFENFCVIQVEKAKKSTWRWMGSWRKNENKEYVRLNGNFSLFFQFFFSIGSNGEFGLCAFYPIDINAIFYFSSHN